jgi:competence protein ComEC
MFIGYIPAWKKAPFIRILVPLMLGITLQWYSNATVQIAWYGFGLSLLLLILFFLLSNYRRYKLAGINGALISIIFLALGSMLAWYKNIRHNPDWYGHRYQANQAVVATLQEPLVEKPNSYKSLAAVTAVQNKNRFVFTAGDLIIYFQKDSTLTLKAGSRIIFSRPLQEIRNTGNPGGFDYKRYNLFQGITHQVYLKQYEFVVLGETKQSLLKKILFAIRRQVLSVLRRYVPGEKEAGLAEALLIGYKDDLDRNLVQSYTNTGVVHVIAISGLHLGLVYWLLLRLLKPLTKRKNFKWLIPVIIIPALWLFSLVAGGQPSVLRSAVMFTCIVIGENFSRKPAIYNTLAISAFILLCVNPYWLWDVGFQLSYAAVLSIVIFMKPIYDWFYIKNKALDFIWKLNAVSMAAQLLTTPFSIYHFHQFPNYFLLTNFVAVPLSSLILLGEILLCAICAIPFGAIFTGKVLSWLIWLMNSYIEVIESLPHSLWDGLQINVVQAILLVTLVTGFGHWLLEKQKMGVWVGLCSVLFFVFFRSLSFYQSNRQRKLIVYNVPRRQAIDLVTGRSYFFVGDSDVVTNDFVRNFNVRPSRILYRMEFTNYLSNFASKEALLQFDQKRILVVDKNLRFDVAVAKVPIDIMVISRNPKFHISAAAKAFNIKQVVFDASVPEWKLKYWTKDCDSLHIPHHSVNEKGAFVMNLN